jgi:Tol biopolymer transport system component
MAVGGSVRAVSVGAVAFALAAAGASVASAHPPGTTDRVSVSTAGAAGDDDSQLAAVSGDGRFVAFRSLASTLVPGDTNGVGDVFVHDRSTGVTERVSVDSRERQAVGDQGGVLDTNFGPPAISGDGRYVVFASSAPNLVKSDRNQVADIFVRDRAAGTTERVSVAGRKTEANGESSHPAISPDGRFVAFGSLADNLVAGDTNFAPDVFLVDRQAGTVERVSLSSTGEQADNTSDGPAVSADGRFVAFASTASNLVPDDTDDASDVFVRDRQGGTTESISIVSPPEGLGAHSGSAAISADGRYVAFDSWEPDLVPGDANNSFDVFVRDRATGVLERVSVDSAGVEGDDWSLAPALSADGRYVAFQSFAGNLVPGDTNNDFDVFVHDRQAGTTIRASVTTAGAEGGFQLGSLNPALSADGRVVAFDSEAALVPEDGGFPVDVFVHAEP